mgnify:CR=1 FL=1
MGLSQTDSALYRRGTAAALLGAPLLFLSVELHYIGAKWPYYTTRDGRTDLLPKTRFVLNDGLDLGPLALAAVVAGFAAQLAPVLLVAGGSFAGMQLYWSNFQGSGLTDIVAALFSLLVMVLFLKVWRPPGADVASRQRDGPASARLHLVKLFEQPFRHKSPASP